MRGNLHPSGLAGPGRPDEEALRQRLTAGELLPQIKLSPTLLARAVANTGQQMELYEYHATPPAEGTVRHATLLFADDTLVGTGTSIRTRRTVWFLRWLDRHSLDDHHTPERQPRCTAAVRQSFLERTATSSRSYLGKC